MTHDIDESPRRTAPQAALSRSRRTEVRALLSIGLPLVGGQLAQIGMGVTDTLLIGRLGAAPLAASVLGQQLFFTLFLLGTGFAYAVMPLAAAAVGTGDVRGLRRSVRMGLWVVITYALVMLPVFWFAEDLFLFLRQDPSVARAGAGYAAWLQLAFLPALAVQVLRNYLSALNRARVFLLAMFAGFLANIPLAWALIHGAFGAPELGLNGAAVATGIVNMAILVILAVICARADGLRQHELFVRFHRPDWGAFRDVVRLGWPIGLTLLAEVLLFAGSGILMGWVGVVPLAAHGIALQLISVLFMIPLGLSGAATVRVGMAMGQGDLAGVRVAGETVLILTVVLALAAGLVCWLVPVFLIGLFLDHSSDDAAAILAYGVPLLAVAAGFALFDWLQVVAAGLLRGLKDTRVPMLIAIPGYALVGLPAAWALGFPLGLGGIGIWLGLALGLVLVASALTWRFLRREALGLTHHPA
jgi:MATE family multidrug resistance protein